VRRGAEVRLRRMRLNLGVRRRGTGAQQEQAPGSTGFSAVTGFYYRIAAGPGRWRPGQFRNMRRAELVL
jgi:hypothetical protein